jgi:hypothetical protein
MVLTYFRVIVVLVSTGVAGEATGFEGLVSSVDVNIG